MAHLIMRPAKGSSQRRIIVWMFTKSQLGGRCGYWVWSPSGNCCKPLLEKGKEYVYSQCGKQKLTAINVRLFQTPVVSKEDWKQEWKVSTRYMFTTNYIYDWSNLTTHNRALHDKEVEEYQKKRKKEEAANVVRLEREKQEKAQQMAERAEQQAAEQKAQREKEMAREQAIVKGAKVFLRDVAVGCLTAELTLRVNSEKKTSLFGVVPIPSDQLRRMVQEGECITDITELKGIVVTRLGDATQVRGGLLSLQAGIRQNITIWLPTRLLSPCKGLLCE